MASSPPATTAPFKSLRGDGEGVAAEVVGYWALNDVVLRMPHLLDAAGDGWGLRCVQGFDLGGSLVHACPIAFLGRKSKGKTYIFNHLLGGGESRTPTPERPTDGIHLRVAECERTKVNVVLIDPHQGEVVTGGWDSEKSKDSRTKSDLIGQVVRHMGAVHIYVLEFLEEADQQRLHELLESYRATQRQGRVVVIHNLRSLKYKEDWNRYKDEVLNLLRHEDPVTWQHRTDVKITIGPENTEIPVEYLDGPNQRHYFLGCSGSPSGENNLVVFKHILDSFLESPLSLMNLQNLLMDSLNGYINQHYNRLGSLQLLEDHPGIPVGLDRIGSSIIEQNIQWFPKDGSQSRVVSRRRVKPKTYSSTNPPISPRSPASPFSSQPRSVVWELENHKVLIRVETPGIKKEELKLVIVRPSRQITVSWSRGLGFGLVRPEGVRTVIQATGGSEGSLEVTFTIPLGYYIPSKGEIEGGMVLEDGVLRMEFEAYGDDEA